MKTCIHGHTIKAPCTICTHAMHDQELQPEHTGAGAQIPKGPPYPKTTSMRLQDILIPFYSLLPVPKKKPRPVQDEQDVENLLEELFNAIGFAQEALDAPQESFVYEEAKDSFERSLGAVERHVRGAIEKSDLKLVENPYRYGGVTRELQ